MALYEVLIVTEETTEQEIDGTIDPEKQMKIKGKIKKKRVNEKVLLGPRMIAAKDRTAALLKAIFAGSTKLEGDPDEWEVMIRPF